MSDPTGFMEMADELEAAQAEIERLASELNDVDVCPDLEDHATLKLVREELAEANTKNRSNRQAAKKFGHQGPAHQYRVEQAFRVVRELVGVE